MMVNTPITYDVDYTKRLPLDRCPWCKIAKPTLSAKNIYDPIALNGGGVLVWATYQCNSCHHFILANFKSHAGYQDWKTRKVIPESWLNESTLQYFPENDNILDDAIPDKIAGLITEALEIKHAPRSCVVACGTAIDAMLEIKNFKKGSLNTRIDAAAAAHLITQDMAKWVHHIRLERNDGAHKPLKAAPTTDEAQLCIDFTLALAEILFVLPARVTRGIKQATPAPKPPASKPPASKPPAPKPPASNGDNTTPDAGDADD